MEVLERGIDFVVFAIYLARLAGTAKAEATLGVEGKWRFVALVNNQH